MSDGLVHVSDEAHAMLVRYCKQHGLQLKSFVSGLVCNEVRRQREIEAARAMRVVRS